MRVPLSWLREHVALPEGETGRAVADRLVRAGLEVETVERVGDLTGPVVVGRVLEVAEEPQKNGRTIRWVQVDVGETAPRGVVCGAFNFAAGDLVVVALPGSVLPGGFAITARKTYGHVSDGMICSTRELGIGDDHAGILVLAPDSAAPAPGPGVDASDVLGLGDEVLDIAVTPDRGYALSIRGIAREAATAYGLEFVDPAGLRVPAPDGAGHPVQIREPGACEVFVARSVRGFDPAARSPQWLQRRVHLAGMRPVSLAVDVTNYVMLELGQPLHAYDADRLDGPIVVRRAAAGELLRTLDGSERRLDPDDLLITDGSGPIGVAGVMGGASTEISARTRSIVLEAAHFEATSIARSSRRHRLSSEASRRFERGVDPAVAAVAAQRAVDLLTTLGGGTGDRGVTVVGAPTGPEPIEVTRELFGRVVGWSRPPTDKDVEGYLGAVGCAVQPAPGGLRVTPPTWRPDLTDPYDLVEEVARLHGYDAIPSVLPEAPAGRGLTQAQRLRRAAARAVGGAGFVEAPSYPFVGDASWEAFGLDRDDPWRRALTLVNPLSEQEPGLRTTLLPGLLRALARNVGRGQVDVALFEIGLVFCPREDTSAPAPRLPVERRPDAAQIAALEQALPHQPRHLGVALVGSREPTGWWGEGHPAGWADAVEAMRTAARAVGADLGVRAGARAPWHPGRCAELVLDSRVVGWAGELHPGVAAALGLPARTCAAEVNLDALIDAAGGPVPAPRVSTYPVATQDVALVLDDSVPAADVERALRAGAGALLESLRLFDVYTGAAVGRGKRSLAYNLRFRATDRTLTAEEASAARHAAVAEAARRTGATVRGTPPTPPP